MGTSLSASHEWQWIENYTPLDTEEELLLSICYHEMLSKFPLSHYFARRLFGTNSILSVEFTASAMRFSNAKLGFLVPFSNLLISAWLIPVFSDNSACVSPASFLARIKDIVMSLSG